MKKLIILIICLCQIPLFSQNLTGTWSCDNGGTYYLRQDGNELWWYGDGSPDWTNVFHGKIHGKLIFGDWADVPSGRNQNKGSATFEIISSSKFRRIWDSGSSSGTVWTRGIMSEVNPHPPKSPAGIWDTGEYNTLKITVNGNRVHGTYNYKAGRIEGIWEGNKVKGTWYQTDGSGVFTFTFHNNYTRFTSKYQGSSGKWYTDWKGKRIK